MIIANNKLLLYIPKDLLSAPCWALCWSPGIWQWIKSHWALPSQGLGLLGKKISVFKQRWWACHKENLKTKKQDKWQVSNLKEKEVVTNSGSGKILANMAVAEWARKRETEAGEERGEDHRGPYSGFCTSPSEHGKLSKSEERVHVIRFKYPFFKGEDRRRMPWHTGRPPECTPTWGRQRAKWELMGVGEEHTWSQDRRWRASPQHLPQAKCWRLPRGSYLSGLPRRR